MPPHDDPIPAEFLAQYDAERAKKLRRRAVIFCVLVLILASYDAAFLIADALAPGYFLEEDKPTRTDLVFDAFAWLLFGGALIHLIAAARTRAAIVGNFRVLVGVAGVAIVLSMPIMFEDVGPNEPPLVRTPDVDWEIAAGGLGAAFLLHLMASVLVALSPREGLVAVAPILIAFAGWALFDSVAPIDERLMMIALSPIAAAPGFAWSWWRYRSFADRFHARAVYQRYAEVSGELAHARRVHEALFPPPITRGPVRMAYAYEPMHAIGGDFLFVRPLSFPPSAPAGPLLVVLIDVTGHGVAAALAVNRLHAELERLAADAASASPSQVITGLNDFARRALAPQGIYATGIALRLSPATGARAGEAAWAGAGHPPALLRTEGGDVRRLGSASPMLGVLDADSYACDDERLPLAPGDVVVAYTDGAAEARDAQGRELDLAGLESLLARASSEAPGGVARALLAGVDRHRAGPADDDVLIVEASLAGD